MSDADVKAADVVGRGAGSGGVSLLVLPDNAIERIFDFLEHDYDTRREFTTKSQSLSGLAFSCRRFATLYRDSVTDLVVNGIFRFTKDARSYHDALSRAFLRFKNTKDVSITETYYFVGGLVADTEYRSPFYSCLDTSRSIDFRLAAADRSSLPASFVGSERCEAEELRVKTLRFRNLQEGNELSCLVSSSTIPNWEHAELRWLDFLPSVTTVIFEDWRTLTSGSRLYGFPSTSVTEIAISFTAAAPREGGPPALSVEALYIELLHFRCIETLVLRFWAIGSVEAWDLLKVLDLLPCLTTFG